MKRVRAIVVVGSALALVLATFIAGRAGAEPRAKGGYARSADAALAARQRTVGTSSIGVPSVQECVARTTDSLPNTQLDCDDPFPNNEPDLVVDPQDDQHMIASSNDYGSCCDQYYTTFNGGKSWRTGNMSYEDSNRIGSDPVTVIDPVSGNAIHASLNFLGTQFGAGDGDVVVSLSSDGGRNWDPPVVVYGGVGEDGDAFEIFNDKEWIVTDTNPSSPHYGRTYLTWTRFLQSNFDYLESPIWFSYSDNGGVSWSTAKEISGSNANFCTFQEDGPAGECDESQGSQPVVAPDGTLYVAFVNEQHDAAWENGDFIENQYMVVRSTNGGATFSAPQHVVDLEDGAADFPVNVNDRQTLTGFQLRIWGVGSLSINKQGNLFLVFMDNRNGIHDSANPVTDADVFYVRKNQWASSWTSARLVDPSATNQWFPWGEISPTTNRLNVVYNDQDGSGTYTITRAELTASGFVYHSVATASSHPNQSHFFQSGAPGCELCATFHGDYINLAYGSNGAANIVWTDMRRLTTVGGETAYNQYIDFARQ